MSDNLLLFNKPYGVLCQFSGDRPNLSDFIKAPGFFPAGRLDKDSEGLLLLTNDGRLQHRIADPKHKMPKVYWVQVEGQTNASLIESFHRGIQLKDGLTSPASVTEISAPSLPERDPPIRTRRDIPTSWLEVTLKEGRNRQVRRMTAACGHPTLRLFRVSIGPWRVDGLRPGGQTQRNVNLPRSRARGRV